MSMIEDEAKAKMCQNCYHTIVGDALKCGECSQVVCADCVVRDDLCRFCDDAAKVSP